MVGKPATRLQRVLAILRRGRRRTVVRLIELPELPGGIAAWRYQCPPEQFVSACARLTNAVRMLQRAVASAGIAAGGWQARAGDGSQGRRRRPLLRWLGWERLLRWLLWPRRRSDDDEDVPVARYRGVRPGHSSGDKHEHNDRTARRHARLMLSLGLTAHLSHRC
jgi:hypothetical protein